MLTESGMLFVMVIAELCLGGIIGWAIGICQFKREIRNIALSDTPYIGFSGKQYKIVPVAMCGVEGSEH